MIDLVALIEQKAGVRLTRKASTGGGEFCSWCPWCGGTDRFLVWPNAERPHYYCRGCNAKGDGIEFLRQYCSLSFFDACQELGIDPAERGVHVPPDIDELADHNQPPCKAWQEQGLSIVERAERYLWHPDAPEGRHWLAYLRGRGLSDETIRRARLGCIPPQRDGSWYCFPFAKWGLDPERLTEEQRKKGGVRVPDGIVIPWFEGTCLWKIAIKRPHDKDFSYGQVLGSRPGLYNVDALQPGQPAMLVESELCALSVQQEAGDLISCVATGSASGGRTSRWIGDLSLASIVLQSFDEDEAGAAGAGYWMGDWFSETEGGPVLYRQGALANCKTRWSTGLWKDPNDLLQSQPNGICTLREWVQMGLQAALPAVPFARQESASILASLQQDEQAEKQMEMIDGIRVYSGYSQEELTALWLQEAQARARTERELATLKHWWK